MHDLGKYIKECMAELDRLRIPYAKNIRFTVNRRAYPPLCSTTASTSKKG